MYQSVALEDKTALEFMVGMLHWQLGILLNTNTAEIAKIDIFPGVLGLGGNFVPVSHGCFVPHVAKTVPFAFHRKCRLGSLRYLGLPHRSCNTSVERVQPLGCLFTMKAGKLGKDALPRHSIAGMIT